MCSENTREEWGRLEESAEFLRNKGFAGGKIAIVLGSGLGGLADEIKPKASIDTDDIPHYPVSSVPGHSGRIIAGELTGVEILAFKGRVHHYEGFSPLTACAPVIVSHILGIESLLLTNAAGAINQKFQPGDIMLIEDFVSFNFINPLRGLVGSRLRGGALNLDIIAHEPYARAATKAASEEGIKFHSGIYGFVAGPSYETRAEVKMLAYAGADALGMSTVPEIITARKLGMKTLALSCITNKAAGISPYPLSHEDVQAAGENFSARFKVLMRNIIRRIKNLNDW